jgi:dTDP-glucose 4,6-dehydratase
MNILITGAAGFIGSNFMYYMKEKHPDDMLIALDKLTYAGNLKNLKGMEDYPNYKFIKGDISDRAFIYKLFEDEKPDVVINFAAESHVDRSTVDPESFMNANVVGVGVLLDACRIYGIKRFHQVSTDEVYGDLPLDRPDLFFTEDTPLHASSPYSACKASADLLALSYLRTFNVPVSITRCSNNYGAYQFPEKLIPLMIANAVNDKKLPVYGNGLNVRDWLYVGDHCSAIELVAFKGKVGEVYNVGGHNERTNLEIIRTILKETGKGEDLITYVTDRPGHDRRYAIDPAKIMRDLGWEPTVKVEEGLKETIKWYLDNRSWWEEIISGEYQNYYDEMYGKYRK